MALPSNSIPKPRIRTRKRFASLGLLTLTSGPTQCTTAGAMRWHATPSWDLRAACGGPPDRSGNAVTDTPPASVRSSRQTSRVFYIVDESLTGAGRGFPSKWFLVARDAFNGRLLWQREIAEWGSRAFESGGSGRISSAAQYQQTTRGHRRHGLCHNGGQGRCDGYRASTGEDLHIYERTEHTDEIVVTGGTMIVSVNPKHRTANTDRFPSPALGAFTRST